MTATATQPQRIGELFPGDFKNPDVCRRNVFYSIDARDLGQINDRMNTNLITRS